MVRGDYGTENASVAKIHLAFRMNNTSDQTKGGILLTLIAELIPVMSQKTFFMGPQLPIL